QRAALLRERKESAGKITQPIVVGFFQGEVEKGETRRRAHGGDVGKIHGKRAPADVGGSEAFGKMAAPDDGVGDHDEVMILAWPQHRAVIADAHQQGRVALLAAEVLPDDLELSRHDESAASRRRLQRAQLAGGTIKNGIHVAMSVRRAEALGECHAFVDDHAIRNVDALLALGAADAKNGKLHRAHLFGRAIEMRSKQLLQFFGPPHVVPQQLVEVFRIDAAELRVLVVLQPERLPVVAADEVLIDRLHREAARVAAFAVRVALVVFFAHGRARIRLTISMAVSAASAPLLPALVPARSSACSMVSGVSTPKATGTPVCMAALPQALAHSPAT